MTKAEAKAIEQTLAPHVGELYTLFEVLLQAESTAKRDVRQALWDEHVEPLAKAVRHVFQMACAELER